MPITRFCYLLVAITKLFLYTREFSRLWMVKVYIYIYEQLKIRYVCVHNSIYYKNTPHVPIHMFFMSGIHMLHDYLCYIQCIIIYIYIYIHIISV